MLRHPDREAWDTHLKQELEAPWAIGAQLLGTDRVGEGSDRGFGPSRDRRTSQLLAALVGRWLSAPRSHPSPSPLPL